MDILYLQLQFLSISKLSFADASVLSLQLNGGIEKSSSLTGIRNFSYSFRIQLKRKRTYCL